MLTRFQLILSRLSRFSSLNSQTTVFDRILMKQIPVTFVYEDDKIIAFKDLNPQAPVHILIIPKFKDGLTGISQVRRRHTQLLGHMLLKSREIAGNQELYDGYRLVINEGSDGQQTVDHLHIHLLGGRKMAWPPG